MGSELEDAPTKYEGARALPGTRGGKEGLQGWRRWLRSGRVQTHRLPDSQPGDAATSLLLHGSAY